MTVSSAPRAYPEGIRLLTLTGIEAHCHQLSIRFSIDGYVFTTTYWFDTADLNELERQYGRTFMQRVYFHIAAFDINKLCSLRPDFIDWGDYSRFVDQAFWALWTEIFRHVWAQWRYENDDPDYDGPQLLLEPSADVGNAVARGGPSLKTLVFFGGGKDSLVATKLLEDIGAPYDSMVYASSVYGNLESQHQMISSLLDYCHPEQRHRQWIFDDFLDSPVIALGPERRSNTLTAAETPASIFSSLPIVLANGITEICLAHEKSSDTGQLLWDRTGEPVNHQWGKSFAAEQLINGYIQHNIVADLNYYSILKPIHDVLIFQLLRENQHLAPHTQSCNISKPWCRRCPKCLYVWLNYMAHLDVDLAQVTFNENLGDVPENMPVFRDLMGLTERLPFDCVGQFNETRLAVELCISKGCQGRIFDIYRAENTQFSLDAALDKYLGIYIQDSAIPQRIRAGLADRFHVAASSAWQYINQWLKS